MNFDRIINSIPAIIAALALVGGFFYAVHHFGGGTKKTESPAGDETENTSPVEEKVGTNHSVIPPDVPNHKTMQRSR